MEDVFEYRSRLIRELPFSKFEDLFDPETITHDRNKGQRYESYHDECRMQGWVNQSSGCDGPEGIKTSFYAKPTEAMMILASKALLKLGYLNYFSAIVFGDEVIIDAKYGQIIGGRPVAKVKFEDWPATLLTD